MKTPWLMVWVVLWLGAGVYGQVPSGMQRLAALEEESRALKEEVRLLKAEIVALNLKLEEVRECLATVGSGGVESAGPVEGLAAGEGDEGREEFDDDDEDGYRPAEVGDAEKTWVFTVNAVAGPDISGLKRKIESRESTLSQTRGDLELAQQELNRLTQTRRVRQWVPDYNSRGYRIGGHYDVDYETVGSQYAINEARGRVARLEGKQRVMERAIAILEQKIEDKMRTVIVQGTLDNGKMAMLKARDDWAVMAKTLEVGQVYVITGDGYEHNGVTRITFRGSAVPQ